MARNDIEYTAAIGTATAVVANNKLDGTGTLVTVLVAGGSITINNVVIKASVMSTEGMVRLFVEDPSKNIKLLEEVTISARVSSGTVPTVSHVVNFVKGFVLEKNLKLLASTENAESFNVFADGLAWEFPSPETKALQAASNTMADISTANTNWTALEQW